MTVRNGLATSIFPMVYRDLARWIDERGFRPGFPAARSGCIEVDTIEDAGQPVFEIQLPFTRSGLADV